MRKKPLFLFLLPLFFVLHGFMDNYDLISVKSALLVMITYIFAAYLIAWLSSFIFNNRYKAKLFTFFLLLINFFFGPLYDFLDAVAKKSFLPKYAFLLPFVFLLLTLTIIWLKKIRQPSLKTGFFANTVLLLLLITDSIFLTIKVYKQDDRRLVYENTSLTAAHVTDKPDIYLIVPDGYAGDAELKEMLQFDNSSFLQQLKERGFHIIEKSTSNYNMTVFSITSTLNMSYLKIKDTKNAGPLFSDCYRAIKHNRLFEIMRKEGYKINDFSIFNPGNKDLPMEESVFPANGGLLAGQTLLGHIIKIIRYNAANKLKWKSLASHGVYAIARNNKNIYDATWNSAEQHDSKPRFIYTHMLMPHSPYYYNKNGELLPFEALLEGTQTNQKNYLGYLQYTSKKIISLIDHIQKESAMPPVIIVMSDHGFRRLPANTDMKYQFINLTAIYLPEKNYTHFREGMSNVNLFRTLLNIRFGQNLPLLQDSSIYLERE